MDRLTRGWLLLTSIAIPFHSMVDSPKKIAIPLPQWLLTSHSFNGNGCSKKCFPIYVMLPYIFGNLSLSHNSSFKRFFFCPILRNVLSPSSFRSLPVGPCVIGSDRDWCLSTAVVHCSTGDLWSPCPTSTTVSSSIFRRKIGLSENWLNHGKGSGTSPRPNSVSGGPAVTTV